MWYIFICDIYVIHMRYILRGDMVYTVYVKNWKKNASQNNTLYTGNALYFSLYAILLKRITVINR